MFVSSPVDDEGSLSLSGLNIWGLLVGLVLVGTTSLLHLFVNLSAGFKNNRKTNCCAYGRGRTAAPANSPTRNGKRPPFPFRPFPKSLFPPSPKKPIRGPLSPRRPFRAVAVALNTIPWQCVKRNPRDFVC